MDLLHILPPDTLVCIQDLDTTLDKIQIAFEKVEAFVASSLSKTDEELKELLKERAFIYPADIMSGLSNFRTLLFTPSEWMQKERTSLTFQTVPQPAFNKNFNLLIDNFNQNHAKGYKNFIFTDNPKQIERFYAIFEDMGVKVPFLPVLKSIHGGFIDHDQK